MYKILFVVYQFFRAVRYSLLSTFFGVVIHCKHKPTCGTYAMQQIKDKGIIIGGLKAFKRVITCW